jgi:hypothetical protein
VHERQQRQRRSLLRQAQCGVTRAGEAAQRRGAESSAHFACRRSDRITEDGILADSITASAPSKTALATSETSARVGRRSVIIESSIWVATMTGFAA